jgi:hypothetical protein
MSALAAIKPKVSAAVLCCVRVPAGPLNLHWAGVGLLALVNLYLLAQMGSCGTRRATTTPTR